MKRNVYSGLFMVASVVTILNFSSCSGEAEDPAFTMEPSSVSVIGEWEVVKMNDIPLEGGYYSIEMEFEEDGDFEYQFTYTYDDNIMEYDPYIGTWEWEVENEHIEVTMDMEEKMSFDIIELTEEKLIMKNQDGQELELERSE